MLKPSVLSVGMGIGVLLLGGSGIAIPILWSRANHAEKDRDQLQSSLREVREARDAGEEALNAAKQQCEEMQKQVDTGLATLATAEENKRVLTNQLAEMQSQDRELTAASGTLQLRDEEMAELRQQLEQTRSDYAALLARRDGVGAAGGASKPDGGAVAAGDLVPVPPRETDPPRDEASAKSQTTAKPAVTEPILFDDSGWKSVAPRAAANTVYRFPITDQISPYLIITP